MSYRYKGRARINPNAPRAVGLCDKCNFVYNLEDLKPEQQWAGTRLVETRTRVCDICWSPPSPAFRVIIPPPDPPSVDDPRPLTLSIDEDNQIATQVGDPILTESSDNLTTE